jgi:CO dehydrogenase maturation factor
MLGQLIEQAGQLTIVDMEASVEHMSRGTVRHVDVVLIVVEPYYRSLETAGRMAPLARDLGIPHVYAVANKVRSERDEAAVREYCAKRDLEVVAYVPFDEAISEADRAGVAVIDHDANAPAVARIRELAHRLGERVDGGEHLIL